MRDLALAECTHLVRLQRLAGAHAHPCAKLLAIALVRDAEHLDVLDFRVPKKEFLDLARIKVLAAADHHVLDAPDDVAVALVVDGGEVAGVHPARGILGLAGLFLVVPVAGHHGIAARAEFAPDPARNDAALAVDDLDLDMRMHATDRRDAALDGILDAALEAHRARLGHAIGDGDVAHVHALQHLAHHRDRAGRARHDAGAQRMQVEAVELGMVEFGDEHRRHAVERGAALGLYGLQRRQRIEPLAGIDHRGPQRRRRQIAHHHSEAMIERHGNADAVLGSQMQRTAGEIAVVEDVVVAERDALRRAGGARSELDVGGIVELDLVAHRGERRALGRARKTRHILEGDRAGRGFADLHDDSQVRQLRRFQHAGSRMGELGRQRIDHGDEIAGLEARGDHKRRAADFL